MADDKIPSGRLARFAKLASLTARTAGDLAVGRARRALGDTSLEQEKQAARKVLETLGTMKGAAMKLGQQLAMEVDGLPPEAREIVAKLFAQAPRASYEDVAGVVAAELGQPPEARFAHFDREPLASASLGQVHRARTHQGREVAVKVQYPGVAEALQSDLRNAALLVKAFNGASRALAQVDSAPYYEEIRREIGAETDYVREASLGRAFAEAVALIPELHVPAVVAEHSTGKVITTELVEGIRLDAFARSDADAAARWRVGRQLVLATFGPVLTRGMVHGDPHPGNFLVRPDGRLTVLDFGAVKQLSPAFVRNFWELVRSEAFGQKPDLLALFKRAGFTVLSSDAEATQTLEAMHVLSAAPAREPHYDWGTSTMVPELRAYAQANFRAVTAIQAPPESLLYHRALGGLANNLRLLRSAGPFREVVRELDALRSWS